jgi:hypothetical protein
MWFRKLSIFLDKLQDQQWNNLVRFLVNPRFGNDSGYTEFETDGTMVATGAATTWDDVYPSSVTVGAGGTAPSFTAYGGGSLKAYEFTGGVSNKELQIGYQLYHSYTEGSTVVPHLHLHINNNGTGGTVIFDLIYNWSNAGDTGAVAQTTVQATITLPADSTVRRNHLLSFGDITGTGKTISSTFMTQIKRRQDLDTFSGSVWLLSADIHIEKNTIGSRQILSK